MKGRGGNPMGMAGLMKQANQLQIKIKKIQEELAEKEYEGSAGGGAVKIKIKGEHNVIAVTISQDLVKSGDTEMLQDLVLAATNEALKIARTNHAAEMEKVTGGFNMPGLF